MCNYLHTYLHSRSASHCFLFSIPSHRVPFCFTNILPHSLTLCRITMHHIASRCITLIHACVYVHVLSLKPQNGLTVGKKEVGIEAGGKAKGTHVICLHILHMSVCSSVSTCRPIYLTFYPTDQPISFSVDSLRSWLTNLRNSIACAALVALLKTHPTATMHAHAYMKAYTF